MIGGRIYKYIHQNREINSLYTYIYDYDGTLTNTIHFKLLMCVDRQQISKDNFEATKITIWKVKHS